jgi:hypothetical protein
MFVMVVLAWINGDTDGQEDVVRVAMVGNSIMYYNDLPRLLEAMSGGRLQQDSCLHGDASLESHLVYGNGMLEKWNTGQARMWDVDEKEAAKKYYYDVYSSYYSRDDDVSANTNDDGGSSSSSSSSSQSQSVDNSYIYDYGACTVEQLLLGYDERLAEFYAEEASQYYYSSTNDDNNNINDDNSNNRRRRHDRKNRIRNLQQYQHQQDSFHFISNSNSTSLLPTFARSERSRERQQNELFRQLLETTRYDEETDKFEERNVITSRDRTRRKRTRRRVEDAAAAGDDNVAVDDDQAAAAVNDDVAADGNDDAEYTSTDDGASSSSSSSITYDDDYYQDTYDEKYPLEDDGTNPCLASANYYFFKQRQYDDFGPPQWDYVLINDNSRSPCCTDQRATSLELLQDVYVPWLRETKAIPIFMVTHSYWSSIRDMSGLTDVPTFLSLTYEGYREYAETVGKALPAQQQPRLAPVGLAFLLVWEENRSMWYNLIHQDEIHLTPTGTYLEGLIVYSTIYGHLPNPQVVLNGDVANLFSNARRMTPSEHIQEAYPTLDQARYLYHIARRIMDGEIPRSFTRYDNGESADFIPDDQPYKNNN